MLLFGVIYLGFVFQFFHHLEGSPSENSKSVQGKTNYLIAHLTVLAGLGWCLVVGAQLKMMNERTNRSLYLNKLWKGLML